MTSLLASGTGEDVGPNLTLRVDADLVDGAFSIHEGVLQPGETIPAHTHETADQLLYVISGAVTATVDGVTVRASAGDFVHKPKGLPHTFTNPTDAVTTVLEITATDHFQNFTQAAAGAAITDPAQFADLGRQHGIRHEGPPPGQA